jgi:hypothetical protein
MHNLTLMGIVAFGVTRPWRLFPMLHLFVLASLSVLAWPGSEEKTPITRQYCTAVGGVFLTFHGDRVEGTYQVLTPRKRINGIIRGKMVNNYIEGRWIDPDGAGQILAVFHEGHAGVSMLYNSDEHPEYWYSVWKGKAKGQLGAGETGWICEKEEI